MFCLPSGFDAISFEESPNFLQMRRGSLAVLGETRGTCVFDDTNVRALFVGHGQTGYPVRGVGGRREERARGHLLSGGSNTHATEAKSLNVYLPLLLRFRLTTFCVACG